MDTQEQEMTLEDLRPGALFVTRKGIYAVKSEYLYPNGECECVLLESGEYAHFDEGNRTRVWEIKAEERGGDTRQKTHITTVLIGETWWDITLSIRVRVQDNQPVFVTVAEIKKSP